jgi:hypothetical protein
LRFIAAQNGGYIRGSLVLHALKVGDLKEAISLKCVVRQNNVILTVPLRVTLRLTYYYLIRSLMLLLNFGKGNEVNA